MLDFITKRSVLEKLFAGAWVAIAVVAFAAAADMPEGSGLYPQLIAALMGFLGISQLIWGNRKNPLSDVVESIDDADEGNETKLLSVLVFFVILFVMIWLMNIFGYLIAGSIGCMAFLKLLFNVKNVHSILITIGIIAFTMLLAFAGGIRLPPMSFL